MSRLQPKHTKAYPTNRPCDDNLPEHRTGLLCVSLDLRDKHVPLFLSHTQTQTRTHTSWYVNTICTRACMHARTHARTHAHFITQTSLSHVMIKRRSTQVPLCTQSPAHRKCLRDAVPMYDDVTTRARHQPTVVRRSPRPRVSHPAPGKGCPYSPVCLSVPMPV